MHSTEAPFRPPRLALAVLLASGLWLSTARAVGLSDTGQDFCYNGAGGLASCTEANSGDAYSSYPRQDGRFGRDAKATAGTLTKVGGGAAGFDYTKVSNSGTDLPASAILGAAPSDWACTRDNVTGLTWEVKVADGGLRDWTSLYMWHSDDTATNGGYPGALHYNYYPYNPPGGECKYTLQDCNTATFVAAVNSAKLCSHADWRLPSYRELLTLVHYGASAPAVEANYFPNTAAAAPQAYAPPDCYLSATSNVEELSGYSGEQWALSVCFHEGTTTRTPKYQGLPAPDSTVWYFTGHVRLVRGPRL